jgi:1-acyl-sn-glycerol-3-phosphate acyltransferase
LGKGIASVSFNLKHGGSVLIDRKKPKLALSQIKAFGKRLYKKNHSAVIFPEGTRSKNGAKKISKSGLLSLFETMPEAVVVPISVGNSRKFGSNNYFPMSLGVKLHLTVHRPQQIDHKNTLDFIKRLEKEIHQEVAKKQLN